MIQQISPLTPARLARTWRDRLPVLAAGQPLVAQASNLTQDETRSLVLLAMASKAIAVALGGAL